MVLKKCGERWFFFWWRGHVNELRQIFDVLDFTYIGLHTSTDAKDIFLELQKQKKDSFSW
jgi:hypothetical protein